MTTRQRRKFRHDVTGAIMVFIAVAGFGAMLTMSYHYDKHHAARAYCVQTSETMPEFNRCMAIDSIGK